MATMSWRLFFALIINDTWAIKMECKVVLYTLCIHTPPAK
jgi:hypothetical protein